MASQGALAETSVLPFEPVAEIAPLPLEQRVARDSQVVDPSSPVWVAIGAGSALTALIVGYINRNGQHPYLSAVARGAFTGFYSGVVTPWLTRRMMTEAPDSKLDQFCINYEVAMPIAFAEMTVFDNIGSRPGWSVLPFFAASLASPFAIEWLEKRGIGVEALYQRGKEFLDGGTDDYRRFLLRPPVDIVRLCE